MMILFPFTHVIKYVILANTICLTVKDVIHLVTLANTMAIMFLGIYVYANRMALM